MATGLTYNTRTQFGSFSAECLVEAIRERFPIVQEIYVFGTMATGEERPDSDLDLAIHASKGLRFDRLELIEFAAQLAMSVGRPVDLVDLQAAPTVLQKEVIAYGALLFTADPFATEMFELFIWSSYQRLNEERREIIEAGLASGRFYQPQR
jgi:predicted nucleotidyltransferase